MQKNDIPNKFTSSLNPEENVFKDKIARSKSAPKWLTFFGHLNQEMRKNIQAQTVKQTIVGSMIF